MKQNFVYGWTPSKLDGTESKFIEPKNLKIPNEYSYVNNLPIIENQGNTNMCVVYALSAHLDWNYNIDHGINNKSSIKIDKHKLYDIRENKLEDSGMTFKEALDFLKKKGITSKNGLIKIDRYLKVNSFIALKYALIMNGPCVAGLYVRNPDANDFWNGGSTIYGGHAVAIVGYNEKGFIIRNSWGTSYGERGYFILKYEDFNKIIECWTIVD